MEIVAHRYPTATDAFCEDVARKRFGRECGKSFVKGHDVDRINAAAGNGGHFVAQRADAGKGIFAEEFARMRFKRDDGGSEPSGVRYLSHRAKESLVAEVNAVEISDGDCAGAFVRGAGKAADNLHAGL